MTTALPPSVPHRPALPSLALLGRDRRGAAAAELALLLAVLLPLLVSGVELGRYILLRQKIERAVMAVGELNARADVLTRAEGAAIFDAVPHLLRPFATGSSSRLLVSGVSAGAGGSTIVSWQLAGAGTATVVSLVGAEGGPATLPAGLSLMEGETIIVAEAFYDYRPLLISLVGEGLLYDRSIFRTRAVDAARLQ